MKMTVSDPKVFVNIFMFIFIHGMADDVPTPPCLGIGPLSSLHHYPLASPPKMA